MELTIPDMRCGGCAKAVTNALNRVDPAARIDIDVPVKIAKVASRLPEHTLIEAIEAAGFHPVRNS
ncbi:heavy-metal-associated domain-containing protein [Paraburkholderia antibiotica]|uniref:Heavy-metal-associated domain-containing protein n=1 Tax=Paraburkholderia antibiotica TaxID=2728839 RepID=A0A7X9X2N6_9BURK|nr:heavy-metal-associated domain-containing protein [Paraburkholderia antibiotica]NML30318.1 heavy-metal-associated domain-containing protein [Paraburkholderia antibiotica]